MIATKLCGGCKATLCTSLFYKAKAQPDGMDRLCKQCRKAATKASVERDPERVAAVKKAWRTKNQDKEAAYGANYRCRNKEKIAATMRVWRQNNKELVRAAAYKWRQENPEKYAALVRIAKKNWLARNPLASRVYASTRRTRMRSSGGSYSAGDVRRLAKQQRYRCASCHDGIRKLFHIDHITPIAMGGRSDPSNLQLLCPPCNLSKGAKHPIDFMQSMGFLC